MEKMVVEPRYVADTAELLKESKRKIEDKYCVRILDGAFNLAVQGLRTFDSKLIFDDASPEKSMEILDGACKLVFEGFKNCAYESAFYEKAYQLRWALVEIIELYMKVDAITQLWVSWLRWERDSASIFMDEFLDRWKGVLESSGGIDNLIKECAEKLPFFKDNASSQMSCVDVAWFLNDIQGKLIRSFWPLLTVKQSDVAEVVSNLTDVPPTLILPSIDYQKQKAIYMTNQRVVSQESVIHEIYETLVSPRRSSTRPRATFLLLGPSGSGKTEIAKAVAEHWYCDASRLVEVDISDYAEESAEACDLSECSREKHKVLWGRLTEVVAKRPYSVIVMDKIDKAFPFVKRVVLEVLSNEAPPSDLEGNPVEFSKSIIFMTSTVGSDQLALGCRCHKQNEDTWKQFLLNPLTFHATHDCTLKGSGPERALIEARKFFGGDLLDSVDEVFVVKRPHNYRAVFRLLLREYVREVVGQRLVVHASDTVLT